MTFKIHVRAHSKGGRVGVGVGSKLHIGNINMYHSVVCISFVCPVAHVVVVVCIVLGCNWVG